MRILKFGACSLALVTIFCADAISNDNYCADANGDGKENIADVTYGLAYMYGSGPPPLSFQEADFDRRRLYTVADLAGIIQCIFCDGPPIDCANDPLGTPVYPTLDTTYKIIYPNMIPANVSTFVLQLNLNQQNWDIAGFTLPLEILIEGQPAFVDSVVFPETDQPLEDWILLSNIHDSGKIVLGSLSIFTRALGAGRFVEVYLTVPNSPVQSTLDIQWTTLIPKLGPAEDSSLYPLVVTDRGSPDILPLLVASCCSLAGDADSNGRINIGDVTFFISRFFAGGAPPLCNDAADANGDNLINISDVTYMIARIFGGGPAPVCGSTGI